MPEFYAPIIPPCATVEELQRQLQLVVDAIAAGVLDPANFPSAGGGTTTGGGGSGEGGGIRLSTSETAAVTDADAGGTVALWAHPIGTTTLSIFDGTSFVSRPFPAPVSLSLSNSAHPANSEHSVYAFWDPVANAVKIGSVAWSAPTVPGSALDSRLDGRLVNAAQVNLSLSSGTAQVAAQRARLVGGFATSTIAGQTEDTFQKRLVSSVDWIAPRGLRKLIAVPSWTIPPGSTTFQGPKLADNVTIDTNAFVEWFHVVAGRKADIRVYIVGQTDTDFTNAGTGINIGASTTVDVECVKSAIALRASTQTPMFASLEKNAGRGRFKAFWVFWSGQPPNASNGTRTFFGAPNNILVQSGMFGETFN